jgi:hypothetical protein
MRAIASAWECPTGRPCGQRRANCRDGPHRGRTVRRPGRRSLVDRRHISFTPKKARSAHWVERRTNRRDRHPQQRTASLRQLISCHLNRSPTASPLRCPPNSEPPPCTATNATTRSSTTPRTRGRSTPCWTGSSPPVGDTLTDVGLPMHFLNRSEDPTDPRRHPPTRIPRPRRGGWPGTPPPPAWTSDMSCLPSLYPLQVCRDLLSGRGPAAGVMSGQDFGNLNHEIRQQGNSGPAV